MTAKKLQGYKAQLGYAAAAVAVTAATDASPAVLSVAGLGAALAIGAQLPIAISGFTGAWAAANAPQITATVVVPGVSVSIPVNAATFGVMAGAPVASAIVNVAGLKELEGGFTAEELDATDHGNNGWKARLIGLLDFSGSAKLDYITGDTSQIALRGALLNSTPLAVSLFPESAPGSTEDSYVGSVIITDFKWDGKNNDLQGVSITMKGAGPFTIVAQ